MNYSNLYEELRLDELGISSDEEAEELEFELELRFEDFTPKERRTWRQQTTYLEYFSRIGTVTSAAQEAGVTGYKAQRWKYDNVLGFTRRIEMATLIFKDRLREKAMRRASDPKAPSALLIELLRAYIPEEFSRNGHKCDTSKTDELLRRYREDARREQEAGHPKLRAMAQGAENAYPDDDLNTETVRPNDYQPYDPSEVSQHQPTLPNRHTGGGRYPEDVPPTSYGSHQDPDTPTTPGNPSAPPAVSPIAPSRAERREQIRQQRKAEKKNTFIVKRF